jgi:hypothetical protein
MGGTGGFAAGTLALAAGLSSPPELLTMITTTPETSTIAATTPHVITVSGEMESSFPREGREGVGRSPTSSCEVSAEYFGIAGAGSSEIGGAIVAAGESGAALGSDFGAPGTAGADATDESATGDVPGATN